VAKARAKYKCKNIHAFKRIFECDVAECKEPAIITCRHDTEKSPVRHERRCIAHVHWTKEPTVSEAKKPEANLYTKMIDHRPWLDMGLYHAGKGR
jgi:hypothetical protein